MINLVLKLRARKEDKEVFNLTSKEIREIHNRGNLTPGEKVLEAEKMDCCPIGDITVQQLGDVGLLIVVMNACLIFIKRRESIPLFNLF